MFDQIKPYLGHIPCQIIAYFNTFIFKAYYGGSDTSYCVGFHFTNVLKIYIEMQQQREPIFALFFQMPFAKSCFEYCK